MGGNLRGEGDISRGSTLHTIDKCTDQACTVDKDVAADVAESGLNSRHTSCVRCHLTDATALDHLHT